MSTLRPKPNLRPIRDRGRNFRIDFNMLQILAAIAVSFFAICKKWSGDYRAHMQPYFPFLGEHSFLYFYSFEHKKASPQNIVSTQPSSTPHMVNFWGVLKETRPMHSFSVQSYLSTAWILLIRFSTRLVPSEILIVFLLKKLIALRRKRISHYDYKLIRI